VFNWSKKEASKTVGALTVDIHSHLLPGLDDGVQTYEESEDIILYFQKIGYKKLITTPHVMSDTFRNTSERILARLAKLQTYLKNQQVDVEIQAAAEYYLDEHVYKLVDENQRMLTFGKNYLLFETNFLNEPFNLKDFMTLFFWQPQKVINQYWHIRSDMRISKIIWIRLKIYLTVAYYFR
jgi:tyrosine-protein phosphatase YwqE